MQRNANSPESRAIQFFLDEFELPGDKCCEGRIAGRLMAWGIWIDMVKTGAPWDYKQDVLNAKPPEFSWGGEYISMCCSLYSYETIANVHYGYVGRAAGLGNYELLIGAGLAQYWDHLLQPILKCESPNPGYMERLRRFEVSVFTFYDEPEDRAGIQIGLDLFNQGAPLQPKAFCEIFNQRASRLKRP